MAGEIKNKTASIYIDDTAAKSALETLQKKADGLNKSIDDTRKKQKALTDEITRAKSAGENYSKQAKELSKLNTELGKSEKALQANVTQQKALQQQIDSKAGPSLKQQQALVNKLVNEYRNLGANTQAAADKLKEIEGASKTLITLKDRLSAVQKVQQDESHGRGIGEVFTKVLEFSGAYALIEKGFGIVHNFMEGTIEEADQAQEAVDGLAVALTNAGRMDLLQPLLDQADKFAEKYKRLDNDDITGVFTKLVDYGKLTQKQIGDITDVIINYAAKQRISLSEATDVFTKGLEGSAKGLKTYGINLTDAKTVTERYNIIVDQLGKKVEGAEAAFEQTPKGIREKFMQSIRDAQEAVGKFIYSLTGLEDRQYKLAVQAKQEADSAQALVSRYEELSKKTNQTAADKQELQQITASLASTFGSSVVEIDKETGALKLNVQATKDLITQKLLLASDAAATEANKYRAALQAQKDAQDETAKSLAVLQTKQQQYGETAEDANKKITFGGGITPGSGSIQDARSKTERELGKLQDAYYTASKKVDDATKQINESAKRLKELGFDTKDVDKLINPTNVNPTGVIGGGNPNENPTGDKEAARKREELQKKLLEDQKKFLEEQHKLLVEYGLVNESELVKETTAAIEKYREQKEKSEEIYKEQLQLAGKNAKLIAAAKSAQAEREKQIEEDRGKALFQIQEKYAKKELDEAEKKDADRLKQREAAIKKSLSSYESILNDVTKDADRKNQLRKAQEDFDISKAFGQKKYQLQQQQLNEEEQLAIEAAKKRGDSVDAVEIEFQQKRQEMAKAHWQQEVEMYLGYAEQILNIVSSFVDAKNSRENAALNKSLRQNDSEKLAYQRMLNGKLISQQQYNKRVTELEQDADKKKEALEKKQFERNKKKQIVQAVINGLQAELKTLAEFGPPIPPNIEGIIAHAFTIGTTIAEIAAIKKTEYVSSSSAKFEKGGIPDGPKHKDGGIDMIDSKTGKKVGEMEGGEPYMILSGKTYKNNKPVVDALLYSSLHKDGARIDPWFKNRTYRAIDFNGISRSIQNVRHYASGGVFATNATDTAQQTQPPIVVPAMTEGQEALMQALLTRLNQPFKGYVVYQEIKDASDTMDAIKGDATFGKKG